MSNRVDELYYEHLGERFNNFISPYDVQQRAELIKKLLPKNSTDMSTLEIGCGTGGITQTLKPLVKNLVVSDISKTLAEKVGKKYSLLWRQADICNLDISDNQFDLVISSECIEHTPDPKKAILEMLRIVKPGGSLIFTSPNKLWYPLLKIALFLGIRKFQGNEIWLFPHDVLNFVKKNGADNLEVRGCHLFPWQIPLAKTLLPFFDRLDTFLHPIMINYGIRAIKRS